jgi:taurine dioxygenase
MASFTITPLTDHTGAEVIGLDFTQQIDIETRATLNRAFAERHVLVMRDQHFAPEQFAAAARLFGELQPQDKKERHVVGHPDVEYISNEEVVDGKRIIPGETFQSNYPRAAATPNTSICMRTASNARVALTANSIGVKKRQTANITVPQLNRRGV